MTANRRMNHLVPAATLAAVALFVQTAAVFAGSRLPALRPVDGPRQVVLDYAPIPALRIPAIEARFVARLLGEAARPVELTASGPELPEATAPVSTTRPRSPGGAGSGVTPGPSTPSPAPDADAGGGDTGGGLLPSLDAITVSMHADRTQATAGEHILYNIVAHNQGPNTVVATFSVRTHTPAWTVHCIDVTLILPCLVPGAYDGTSADPGELHLYPLPLQHVLRLRPGQSGEVARVVVQVLAAVPDAVLHNHAHVEVLGDGRGAITVHAPQVTVSAGVTGVTVP